MHATAHRALHAALSVSRSLHRWQVVLGLYIVRGDNMCASEQKTLPAPRLRTRPHAFSLRCPPPTRRLAILRSALVGEVDEELDAELALDEIVAEPLKPVVH